MRDIAPQLFIHTSVRTCFSHLTLENSRQILFFDIIDNLPDLISPCESSILIMDFVTAIRQSKRLRKLYIEHTNCYTVIVQAPDTVKISELIMLGRLKGLFYQRDNTATVQDGIAKITKGEFCLSESVLSQLLSYYQSVVIRHGPPHKHNLTLKEVEVLKLLKERLSNNQLADELHISEHTVKSHLYKIFKKLEIKNRNQAIEWAYKFLP